MPWWYVAGGGSPVGLGALRTPTVERRLVALPQVAAWESSTGKLRRSVTEGWEASCSPGNQHLHQPAFLVPIMTRRLHSFGLLRSLSAPDAGADHHCQSGSIRPAFAVLATLVSSATADRPRPDERGSRSRISATARRGPPKRTVLRSQGSDPA